MNKGAKTMKADGTKQLKLGNLEATPPVDLKVTYLPREYNPTKLDKDNPERSRELKRDFDIVFQKIDNFFDTETVSNKDEIVFTFGRKTYTAVTKVLIITK